MSEFSFRKEGNDLGVVDYEVVSSIFNVHIETTFYLLLSTLSVVITMFSILLLIDIFPISKTIVIFRTLVGISIMVCFTIFTICYLQLILP